MDYPKVPAAEIVLRREKLEMTVKQICRALRVSEPTWKRWERETSAPAFVHFLLAYLETGPQLQTSRSISAPRVLSKDAWVRFKEKMSPGPHGCLLWAAGGRFKMRGGESVGPRKAAWFFAHGEIPERDVLITCENQNCVAPEHLKLGKRTGEHKGIAPSAKSAILLELRQGKLTGKQLAAKYSVSAGTISALKKLTTEGVR